LTLSFLHQKERSLHLPPSLAAFLHSVYFFLHLPAP